MTDTETPSPDHYPVPRDDEEGLTIQRDWTVEEEKKAKWKSVHLGSFLLDTFSSTDTDNFMKDIGITQDQFNVCQQILSLGIVLFEIPSNMILYRANPGRKSTIRLFSFGLASTFQAFQNNYASFITTRFLLGLTESGFFPGGLWTISTWYTRKKTAKRVMIFHFGNQFGQASAKLFAYGILHMRGVAGRSGWFWLFVPMGGFTCFCGFIFDFFLPDSFRNPCSAFLPKRALFTAREIHALRSRVLLDDPAKGKKKKRVGLTAFKKAFSNWRIYVSDHLSRRGETIIAGLSMHLLGYIFNRIFTEIHNRRARYAGVVWTQTFGTFSHPLNITLMSLTCTDSEERALAMAMVIIGANIAGIYGAQIFRADDRPRCRRAFNVNIAVLAFSALLAVLRFLDEKFRRKKVKDTLPESGSESERYGDGVNEATLPASENPQSVALGGLTTSFSPADP
ncbi:putative MFS transporter, partial [Aureobasidium melanogenum]